MEYAHSVVASKWINDVVAVTKPGGSVCYTYKTCSALINEGKRIKYYGAGSDMIFNKYHNVAGGFIVEKWNSAHKLYGVYTERASALIKLSD